MDTLPIHIHAHEASSDSGTEAYINTTTTNKHVPQYLLLVP